eukprot:16446150-Heterocapsa_arctica.AAC.1
MVNYVLEKLAQRTLKMYQPVSLEVGGVTAFKNQCCHRCSPRVRVAALINNLSQLACKITQR